MPETPHSPLVTLLTDFGSRDTYVGQMKGAMLSVCTEARLVDLTQEIPPGDVLSGAVAWGDAVPAFPPQTVHLGVVDPGVGTARRAVAAEIGPWRFVCPDNGLLTVLLQAWPLVRAVELTERKWWRPDVSPVFHGRDLFGPVAAHWAAGRDLTEFGPPISEPLIQLDLEPPQVIGSKIQGTILTVDRFGNLRTNISADLLTGPPDRWVTTMEGQTIRGLSRCFGDREAGDFVSLIGSHGQLEIAVNQGNAAERLHAAVGTSVKVQRQE